MSARGWTLARRTLPLLLALAPAACDAQARTVTDVRSADALRRSGQWDAAIAAYRPAADSGVAGARRGLLRTLATVGRHDEAERLGRAWASSPEVWLPLAEVLRGTGKRAAAESLLVRAASGSADSLQAQVQLAELRLARGDGARAWAALDRIPDAWNARRGRLTPEELAAVARACELLGARDPQLFKDALKAWDAAIAADSADPAPRIALARLFLSKYAATDAGESVRGALRLAPTHPDALVAAARIAHFGGGDSSRVLVERALAVNPRHVDGRAFLAFLLVDSEDAARAAQEAEKALAVDPASLEALAVLGAAKLLGGDERGFAEVERRALATDPRAAGFHATVAEAAVRHRMYARGVALARRGTQLDSTDWRAQSVLGLNLMRIGEPDEARRVLERAFRGDPYNAWVKNTLDLLDTYDEYEYVTTPHFRFMIDRRESALLGPYLSELLEEAHGKLAARYGFTPETPVTLEVFRSHADFSVRTVGLAGLGALGVSFGSTLAMDSPGARKVGEFNWASTAWHELAHAFTLGMSGHQVSRWLTEGLSVLEERRARPGWGTGVSLLFLAALDAGTLVPPSRLTDGFVRPRHANEVMLSYYQASLLCEMIEQQWGTAKLVGLLRAQANGRTIDEAIEEGLGVSPAELDRRWETWAKARFASSLRALRVRGAGPDGVPAFATPRSGEPEADDYLGQVARARQLAGEDKPAEAIPYLRRAAALIPELGGEESPRWPLARLLEQSGDARGAMATLDTLVRHGEAPYEALLALARLKDAAGDRAGAADALERAIWVSPYDPALHQRLAALYEATGAHAKAVRERRAVVALAPVDRAEALYQLALAQEKAGDRAGARRTVLQALEDAPNFERAQELLLRLTGGT